MPYPYSSLYGVYKKHDDKYFASIKVTGKTHYIGSFISKTDASLGTLLFIKKNGCTCNKIVYSGV